MSRSRTFAQVDVFAAQPYHGNPVAVVVDGDGLDDATMQRVAAWTGLSETTFVVPPTARHADYGLRIFTPRHELPFAGHPTLGSAHAWLEAGGTPARENVVVQECGVGLVELRRTGERLSFRAPPLQRSGPVDDTTLATVARGLRLRREDLVDHRWVDNGPGWLAVRLASPEQVLALEPDDEHLRELMLGVVATYPPGGEVQLEVRGLCAPIGVREDPVTGSLNAGLGSWLIEAGDLPPSYVASQGARVGRQGRVHVQQQGDDLWVGGTSTTCIRGTLQA
jgi:PhzF family phenazine biosynthesis protein